MSNAIAGVDFAEIVTDTVYERSPELAAQLLPLMPSQNDITAEFKRELATHVGGIEFMPASGRRYVVLGADPERLFPRKRVYARLWIDHQVLDTGDVDAIRSAFFDGTRKIAAVVADIVNQERASWGPPPGASVTYTSAMASPSPGVAIRVNGHLPTTIKEWGETTPRVYRDINYDSVIALMGGYFFVTPLGDEVIE